MNINLNNMFAKIKNGSGHKTVRINGYCLDEKENKITLFISGDTATTFLQEEVKIDYKEK